jgi:hypothetical protein
MISPEKHNATQTPEQIEACEDFFSAIQSTHGRRVHEGCTDVDIYLHRRGFSMTLDSDGTSLTYSHPGFSQLVTIHRLRDEAEMVTFGEPNHTDVLKLSPGHAARSIRCWPYPETHFISQSGAEITPQ